jgi:hypothetical protein
LRHYAILALLALFAAGYHPTDAHEATGAEWDAAARDYYKSKAAAWAKVWDNVANAAGEGNYEEAARWGDLAHKWAYDYHPNEVVKVVPVARVPE